MARAPKPNKNRHSRPMVPIDWEMVDRYLIAGCSGIEVASVIGCHHETLYERCERENGILFSEYSRQKKNHGDSLLRAKQFQKAMSNGGDNTMLIFLGKTRLKQREEDQNSLVFDGKLSELLDKLNTLQNGKDESLGDSSGLSNDPQDS